jgi:hypothetical protein
VYVGVLQDKENNMTVSESTTVDGVEVVGDRVFPAKGIPLTAAAANEPDEDLPIAVAAGIPLRVRKKAATGQRFQNFRIVRMMSLPSTGLAPIRWQFGGRLPPAPPVLVFRTDGIPFTVADFDLLDDFEMAMLDDGPRPVTRADWEQWCSLLHDVKNCPLKIELKYPKGRKVRVTGLQRTPELNGTEGVVAGGSNYTTQRVGIILPEPHGLKGVKLDNIELV